jgi:hypothetical protein
MIRTRVSQLLIGWVAYFGLMSQGVAQMPELRRADLNHVPVFDISHVTGDVYRAAVDNHATLS